MADPDPNKDAADDDDAVGQQEENDEQDQASQEANAQESDNDDDDDDEANDQDEQDSESASEDSDSSSDDDDSSNQEEEQKVVVIGEDGHALSAYEIQRLERIRRNKEYLASLGLEKNNEAISAAKKKKKPARKKQPDIKRRSSISRASKEKVVTYSERKENEKKEAADTNKPKEQWKRKKENRGARMERFIHDEFRRIGKEQKVHLKRAQTNVRKADVEFRIAKQKAERFEKKQRRQLEYLQSEERSRLEQQCLGGFTARRMLQEIDSRAEEIRMALKEFDQKFGEDGNMAEWAKQQEEKRKKMELIDAMDRFPRALKDSIRDLDVILLERSPRDPPPPRRGTRKRNSLDSTGEAEPTAKMRALESPDGSKEKLAADETWSSLASAITAETLNSSSRAQLEKPSPGDVAEDGDSKPAAKGRPKKKRETIPKNVGGWVSPAFAQDIDRSWLEADNTPKKFDLSSYIPQVGDTVLYYPAGHRQFLEANPDILGKKTRNITRMTLWDRAKKEKSKMEKATAQDEADNGESQVNAESKVSNWWNEDWLSLIDGDLDRYPILCRVEKTHAEFPPDPLSDAKVVTNDKTGAVQVTWKPKKGGPKKHQESPPLRLAVMLRPLTPALPPQQSSGDSASTELALPPNFYVVTFPSKASPFLIPFSLAYKLSHSLSNGDAIRRASSTKPDWRGKVANFKALESDSLHFSTRLDDKMDSIRELCDSLKSGKKTFAASLEEALYSDSRATIPLTDACVVIERFESALKDITADTTGSRKKSDGTTPNMMHLIRSTLPLWNEVVVASGSGKERSASAWELWSSNEEAERAGPLISTPADIEPESGLVYTIDEPLRAKLECTIEDFLKDTPDAGLFFQLVTDEEAPSYSQAVPRGMAFSKILKRLQVGKRQGESRCYYRTIDSLLGDVVAIADNCFLYNSPESLVVQKVDEIIPAIKRLIAHVTSQHLKEKEAIEKSIEERRQAIMMQCNAPAVRVDENEGNELSSRNRAGPAKRELQQPYNGILHRTWIQDIVSDKSWSVSDKPTDQQSSTARVVGNVEWVPQSGDNIFYSRSLHADFVKGHHPSLTTEQCIVPQLSTESDNAAPDTLQDHWLVGKIVWVRAAFPRAPSKRDPDYENTFEVASPVLELGMRFHYSWASKNIYTVFWRPCTFAKEGEDDGAKTIPSKVSSGKKRKSQGSDAAVTAGTEDESTKSPARCKCNACGLDVDASFVRPTWISLANQGSTGSESAELTSYLTPDASSFAENPFANPTGIPEQSITSIGRCLDVLKRRCLDGVPANHVDPRLTTANVKDGFSPPAAKIGRNLPTFDRLLTRVELGDNENVTIGMGHTDKRNVALLAEANYLPQWTLSLSEGMRKKTNPNSIAQRRALHETLSPNPNFCLELIQARLRGGYYRNIIGLAHDIQEAYVSSVLLLLARPAARKVQPISIRRIAKALASTKDLVSFAKTNSKATSKKAAPVVKLEEKETAKNSSLSNEEQEWFEQLFHIRKLYATALASVLQPECTERVFGVVPPKTKPKAAAKKKPAAFDAEKEQAFMKARNTLGFIFETLLIKDPCGNRPVAASWNPSVKVRIRFTGQEPQKKGGKRASNAKLPMSGEDSRPVDDVDTTKPLVFESSDYEFNEDLVTLFFGKPLKMSRCGRCSAHGRSIMMCRVRRKHELPDFDWLTVFQGSGGLDGLLHTLRTGEPPGEFMSAGSVANRPENQPSGASVNVGGDLSNAIVGKVAPIAILEKAKKAVMFADQVLAKAEKFSKAPVRLSEEFVKHSFPIDPDDDHYNYCILCGLIGDVICCEGCPNVVHPRCVNLEDIPDEDWYCSRCQREGKVPAIDEKTNGKNVPESQKPSAIATACEGPDLLPETMAAPDGLDDDADRLETILAELKSMRPIQPKKLKQPKKASDEEQKGEDSDKDGDSDKDDEDDEPSPPALSLRRSSRNPRRSGSGDDNDDSSLGEDSDHDVRAPPSRIRVGMRVKKKFGDRYFYGKILEVPNPEHSFYLVRYEDDDEEDLEEDELREKVKFIDPKTNRSSKKSREANREEEADSDDNERAVDGGTRRNMRRSRRQREPEESEDDEEEKKEDNDDEDDEQPVDGRSRRSMRRSCRPREPEKSADDADSSPPKKRARRGSSPPKKKR